MAETTDPSETASSEADSPTRGKTGGWPLAIAVVLCAANLRPAVSSVGPVLEEVRLDLGLSGPAVSVLTALPVLCFGVGALVAPAIARRIGTELTLVLVLAVTTAGLLLRLGPDPVTLFAGTLFASLAIAIANVLIPALVKREYADHAGLMMGIYIGTLVGFASLAAGVTVPIVQAFDGSWRVGLGVWAVPAGLGLLAWIGVTASRRRRSVPSDRTSRVPATLLRDGVAWHVTLFMGLQSLVFYALLAWLPTVMRSHGVSPEAAGHLLSLMVIIGVPTALLLPSQLARSRHQKGWAAMTVVFAGAGLIGMMVAPTAAPVVWTVMVGLGTGAAFPLALTLVVLRSRHAEDASQLSAMSQSVGYVMAAGGPFVFGLLHDLTGTWNAALGLLLALLVPQLLFGVAAGRPVAVREPR